MSLFAVPFRLLLLVLALIKFLFLISKAMAVLLRFSGGVAKGGGGKFVVDLPFAPVATVAAADADPGLAFAEGSLGLSKRCML